MTFTPPRTFLMLEAFHGTAVETTCYVHLVGRENQWVIVMTGPRRVVKGSSTQAWASSCGQVIQTCAFSLSLMETNHCTTDSDHLDVTVITQAKKKI